MKALEHSKKVSARMPEGGMFVMVDVRKTGLSGEEFARRLLADPSSRAWLHPRLRAGTFEIENHTLAEQAVAHGLAKV